MSPESLTPENLDEAREIQESLRTRVRTEDDFPVLRHVAGVDVGFENEARVTRAAVVILDAETLVPIEQVVSRGPTLFPYIPGFLSFREIPEILRAFERLSVTPDLVVVDGHGIAHPRGLGIAAHLGVLTGLPAIGAAKSLLVGAHGSLGEEKGARAELRYRGRIIGHALRTRTGVKPLYVSPGHRVSIPTATDLVLRFSTKYRLPETTRLAHRLASVLKHVAA